MEIALNYLEDIKSHLETLTPEQIRTFKVTGLPALHYLATLPAKPEDLIKLDQVIKLFKNAGCDLNEKTDDYFVTRRRATPGFTPLMVAIEQKNLQLVECLLENGARLDVSDQQGFFPLHWAVFVGDVGCFRKLIEAGALEASSRVEDAVDVHPILHTAVDEGETEIVKYLLEHRLVDIHQEVDSKGSHMYDLACRSELHQEMDFEVQIGGVMLRSGLPEAFTEITDTNSMEPISMRFTPLARAVRMGRRSIVEMLLKYGANVSGFNELHHCILQGEVEIACLLLDQFSPQDLATDKIEDKWSLHCLPHCAFRTPSLHKTIELINAYVAAGWDLNAFGRTATDIKFFGMDPSTEFNLLHLACYFKSLELVKYLLKMGSDVNARTRGSDILYPMQVSILQDDWSSVKYLMANGADVHAVGGFKTVQDLDWVSEPGSRDIDLECHFTSLELLLQLGNVEGMGALEEMLKKGIPPPEKIAFQRAIHGECWKFVSKVVEQLCGIQKVKMEDMTWLPISKGGGATDFVPSLNWLIRRVIDYFCSCHDIREEIAKVVEVMGKYGYDFTLKLKLTTRNMWRNVDEPLIFSILKMERPFLLKSGLHLLEAILKFEKVELNVRNSLGLNPVEYVIQMWSTQWTSDIRRKTAAVDLLIRNGVDVSEVVIGKRFKYFQGYLSMMQMLHSVGAKIHPEHFILSIAEDDNEAADVAARDIGDDGNALAIAAVIQEIDELKEWKKEFDKERKLTLKHLSVVQVRRTLKTIQDLRNLDDELPEEVKEEVVGQIINF